MGLDMLGALFPLEYNITRYADRNRLQLTLSENSNKLEIWKFYKCVTAPCVNYIHKQNMISVKMKW